MSDLDATTPRVFIARHGETEWTINGRYTGVTELQLTPNGTNQVLGTAKRLVGPGKLINPARLARVFVSPRQRAQVTCQLLLKKDNGKQSWMVDEDKLETTEMIAEWDYGRYEGMKTVEIRELRTESGLDGEGWDIWRDGCEGGESAQQVSDRLDALIGKIYDIQRDSMHGEKPADVLVVAHGHILRAFTKRWLKYPLAQHVPLMMSPGAIGVLSYEKHSIEKPALFIGMSLPYEE